MQHDLLDSLPQDPVTRNLNRLPNKAGSSAKVSQVVQTTLVCMKRSSRLSTTCSPAVGGSAAIVPDRQPRTRSRLAASSAEARLPKPCVTALCVTSNVQLQSGISAKGSHKVIRGTMVDRNFVLGWMGCPRGSIQLQELRAKARGTMLHCICARLCGTAWPITRLRRSPRAIFQEICSRVPSLSAAVCGTPGVLTSWRT